MVGAEDPTHRTIVAGSFGLACVALALACGSPASGDGGEPGSSSTTAASDSGVATLGSESTAATVDDGAMTGSVDGSGTSADGDGSDSTGPTEPPPPLDDLLRMNHMQAKGTHNSYHQEPPIPFHPSHEYTQPSLPDQLELHGVRAFELDVHREINGTINVYHILGIDQVSSCDTFEACLSLIKAWSDLNPLHLPVVVWVEIKDDTGGLPIDDMTELDDIVRDVFPPEQLLTPDDVQGDYPSLRERLVTEGWPVLGEVRGQVLVVVLDGDAGSDYSNGFTDLSGRPMFVRVGGGEFDLPVAAIAKLGAGDTDTVEAAHAQNLLIATNVCGADESDDDCFAQRDAAVEAGIHMLKDDFPAQVPEREYWLDLPEGNPVDCNPVTAPPECTAEALESL